MGKRTLLLILFALVVGTVLLNAFLQVVFHTSLTGGGTSLSFSSSSDLEKSALVTELRQENHWMRRMLEQYSASHGGKVVPPVTDMATATHSRPDPRDLGQCSRKAPTKSSLFESRRSMQQKIDAAREQKSTFQKKLFAMHSRLLKRDQRGILLRDGDNFVNRTYKRCAVVGNGGVLLNDDRNGESIDAHDAVFRINEGPTRGFEKYVGERTTFRVNYLQQCGSMSADEFAHILCVSPMMYGNDDWALVAKFDSWQITWKDQKVHLKAYQSLHEEISKRHAEKDTSKPLYMGLLNTDFFLEMRNKFKSWPTTGACAIRAAIEICDCVDIYGFSAGRAVLEQTNFRYHYFDSQVMPTYQSNKDKRTGKKDSYKNPHKYDREGSWLRELERSGTIRDKSFPPKM